MNVHVWSDAQIPTMNSKGVFGENERRATSITKFAMMMMTAMMIMMMMMAAMMMIMMMSPPQMIKGLASAICLEKKIS